MSKEHAAPLVPQAIGSISAAAAPACSAIWQRAIAIVLAGSALAAICARVSIPLYFTPVPLSLTPFAVCSSACC